MKALGSRRAHKMTLRRSEPFRTRHGGMSLGYGDFTIDNATLTSPFPARGSDPLTILIARASLVCLIILDVHCGDYSSLRYELQPLQLRLLPAIDPLDTNANGRVIEENHQLRNFVFFTIISILADVYEACANFLRFVHRWIYKFRIYLFHLREGVLGDDIDIMACTQTNESLSRQLKDRNPQRESLFQVRTEKDKIEKQECQEVP